MATEPRPGERRRVTDGDMIRIAGGVIKGRRYHKSRIVYDSPLHERMSALLERASATLPCDYRGYGAGTVERWAHDDERYPDCSGGCRWAVPLAGDLGCDWNVCTRPDAPHCGGVVFEHQVGKLADCVTPCAESERDYRRRRKEFLDA